MRYLLLATHYRQKLNFTFEGLRGGASAIERMEDSLRRALTSLGISARGLLEKIQSDRPSPPSEEAAVRLRDGFIKAMDDDLNISKGLAAVFEACKEMSQLSADQSPSEEDRRKLQEILKEFFFIDHVLGIIDWEALDSADASVQIDEEERRRIEELIAQRSEARKNKDFAEADRIRDLLLSEGIELKDSPDGTTWTMK